jgi:hypothetical protein
MIKGEDKGGGGRGGRDGMAWGRSEEGGWYSIIPYVHT